MAVNDHKRAMHNGENYVFKLQRDIACRTFQFREFQEVDEGL